VAGSAAGGAAAARYFTDETLKPENETMARYYAGETVPDYQTEVDHLGQSVAAGDMLFTDALDDLITSHAQLHGYPEDIDGLEERLTSKLLQAVDRADARDAVAGGTVARVREDLDPQLAEKLGIDTSRQLTRSELAHLLSGLRADGEALPGRQLQKPMKSVAEVFGLDAKALPTADTARTNETAFWYA